jgi:hypothetical protein
MKKEVKRRLTQGTGSRQDLKASTGGELTGVSGGEFRLRIPGKEGRRNTK